jgi:hypothetical protein
MSVKEMPVHTVEWAGSGTMFQLVVVTATFAVVAHFVDVIS